MQVAARWLTLLPLLAGGVALIYDEVAAAFVLATLSYLCLYLLVTHRVVSQEVSYVAD